MQDLKLILDTDFKYRLKPLKTQIEIDIKIENQIEKKIPVNKTEFKTEKSNTDI